MSQCIISSSDAPYTLCSRDTMASDGVLQVAGFQGTWHDTHAHTHSSLTRRAIACTGASMLDPATLPPFSYSPFESPSLFKGFSFLCKGFDSAKEVPRICRHCCFNDGR